MLPNPIKLYAEIAVVLAAAALFAWFIHAQREKGRQQVLAANARAEAAAIIHQAEVESRAQTLADQSISRLKDSLRADPPRDALTVRVCKPAPRRPVEHVPTDGEPRPPADAAGGLSAGVEEGRDIGPVTEQILARANAKVKALQEYIQACVDTGICKDRPAHP